MAQKKNSTAIIVIIGVIIAIAIISYKLGSSAQVAANNFISKEKSNVTLAENLDNGQAFPSQTNSPAIKQVNICNSLSSYTTLMQGLCVINGGAWICNSNEVSCNGLKTYHVNCSDSNIQTATADCNSIGAQASCDTTDVSCKY